MKYIIPDWRSLWRKWTTQLVSLLAVYGLMPVDYQQAVMGVITGLLVSIGIEQARLPALFAFAWLVLRLLKQKADEAPPAPSGDAPSGERAP